MLTAPQPTKILDEILCATEEQITTSDQRRDEFSTLLSLCAGSPKKVKKKANRSVSKKSRLKRKVTAYISENILEGFEKVRSELQLLVPVHSRITFSRSNLLDTTVALFLEKFSDNKTHKKLLRELLKDRE